MIEHLNNMWMGSLYRALWGAVWGLVALLCARAFSHGENRIAIEQVGLRPMLTGAALRLFVVLQRDLYYLLVFGPYISFTIARRFPEAAGSPELDFLAQWTSPAEICLLAVVYIAATAYFFSLDSQRSAQILLFPLLAPLYAIAGVIGKTDSFVRYVSNIAAGSAEPHYMVWSRRFNIGIAAYIVIMAGLWVALLVFVNR